MPVLRVVLGIRRVRRDPLPRWHRVRFGHGGVQLDRFGRVSGGAFLPHRESRRSRHGCPDGTADADASRDGRADDGRARRSADEIPPRGIDDDNGADVDDGRLRLDGRAHDGTERASLPELHSRRDRVSVVLVPVRRLRGRAATRVGGGEGGERHRRREARVLRGRWRHRRGCGGGRRRRRRRASSRRGGGARRRRRSSRRRGRRRRRATTTAAAREGGATEEAGARTAKLRVRPREHRRVPWACHDRQHTERRLRRIPLGATGGEGGGGPHRR